MSGFLRLCHLKQGGQAFSPLRWAVIGCGLLPLLGWEGEGSETTWAFVAPPSLPRQPRHLPREGCICVPLATNTHAIWRWLRPPSGAPKGSSTGVRRSSEWPGSVCDKDCFMTVFQTACQADVLLGRSSCSPRRRHCPPSTELSSGTSKLTKASVWSCSFPCLA